MFLTRKIGSFLRGKATRGQVFVAALLAGILGFVPGFFLPNDLGGGFLQAPGLILSIFFLVLVLNANLGVFGLVTLVAKLTSLVAMPASFAIGRALIDGPLQPLFRTVVNAPVTAWFGLDHYATTGGLVLGMFFGTATGMLFVRALMSFRRRMADLEANSAAYQKNSGKTWVRFVAWVLFGSGKSKKLTWAELADAERGGRAFRLVGVVLVIGIAGGLYVFQTKYSTPLLTESLRSSLTAANGATVDVAKVELDLAGGALRVTDLAIADSKKLDTDLFAAAQLEAKLDTTELLRKRIVIDTLFASNARSGGGRATPGTLTPAAAEPLPPPDATQKTIDDYLKDVEVWRQRLQQVRDIVGKIGGSSDPAPTTPEEQRQQIEKQVEQQIDQYGLAKAVAVHLHDELPLIEIKNIEIKGIDSLQLGKKIDLQVTNFSSNAHLLPNPPTIRLAAADQSMLFQFSGPSKDSKGAAIELALKNLAVDTLMAQFKTGDGAPVRGGTIDLSTKGFLQTHTDKESTFEMPLQVTLKDTTLAIPGTTPTKVDSLVLPIGLRGFVTRPQVGLDDKVLADALMQAGKKELANFVTSKAGQLLGNVPGAAGIIDPNKTPEQMVDDAKKAAEDAAKKAADDAKKAAEDAAKKAAEEAAKKAAAEAAKKGLGDGLKGLLPGGKKN